MIFSLLSGCILVPGSNIDPGTLNPENGGSSWFETGSQSDGVWFPSFRREQEITPEAEQEILQTVDVVTITSNLVARQQRQALEENAIPASMPASLQQEIANYEYHVERGDVLQVTVYDHPELTNPSGSNNNNVENSGITVENDGTIYYPYIGKVPVAGRTVDEIREAHTTGRVYYHPTNLRARGTFQRQTRLCHRSGQSARPAAHYQCAINGARCHCQRRRTQRRRQLA